MADKNFLSSLFEPEDNAGSRYALPPIEETKPGRSQAVDVPAAAPTKADVVRRATELGVNPMLALSIFNTESSGNFGSKDSPKGAKGGFQVMDGTFKEMMGTTEGIRDPWKNMEAGLRYLAHGQKVLGTDDPELLAAGYHAGYGRKELKEGRIPDTNDGIMRTADYARKVARGAGGMQKVSADDDAGRFRDLTPDELANWQKASATDDEAGRFRDLTDDELKTWQSSQESGVIGDLGKNLKIGMNTAAQDMRELVGRIPVVGQPIVKGADAVDKYFTGKTSDELLKSDTEQMTKSMSPDMQGALEKKWWDSEKGTFGPAWTDWRSYAGGVTQSLPEQALTMVPAMRLAKAAYATKIAAGASVEAASLAASRAAMAAGAISEGSLGGAQSARDVRDEVLRLDDATLAQSEAYQSLLSSGMQPDEAKRALAEDLSTRAFVTSGVATGLFGGMGDRVIAKMLTEKVGKSVVKNAVKGFAKGAVGEGLFEELPQSALQQLSKNEALKKANPKVNLSDDVANQALGGLALGGVQGGGMGGMAGAANRNTAETASAPQSTPAETQAPAEAQTPATSADTTPAAPPAAITPASAAAPVTPAGPLSGSVEKVAEAKSVENLPRATVSAPEGTITGVVESYQEDGQGGFVARVVGDDGQVYQFTQADGLQIAIEQPKQSGPLSGAVEQVAESAAPAEPVQADQAQFPEQTVAPATEPTAAPASAEPAASLPAQAQAAEPAQQTNLDDMALPELRARLKSVAEQAKVQGPSQAITAERRQIERAINRRIEIEAVQPKEQANGRDASTVRVRNDRGAGDQSITPQRVNLEGGSEARPQPHQEREAAAVAPLPGARADLSGAGASSEPGAALKDIAAGRRFSTPEKAEAFIAKNNLAATHSVQQTGKVRFEVKPKSVSTAQNDASLEPAQDMAPAITPENVQASTEQETEANAKQPEESSQPSAPAAVPAADGAVSVDAGAGRDDAEVKRTGKATAVKVNDKKVGAEWMVVDADELEATLSKSDNQYRDRNRAASKAQIGQIANAPDFDLLAEAPVMDYGAPTLAKDGKTIIGGNGRFAGLAQAYEQGTAEGYRKALEEAADRFGVSLDGVKKPVLVRRFTEDVDVKSAAIASNEGGGLKMSALEQAKVDAERMGDMADFVVGDNGDINTAANQRFIRNFLSKMPSNQQASFMDADGKLSQEGIVRIRNAVLYRAYGDSPALARIVESADQGLRNIVTAFLRVAPKIADVKARIAEGDLYDLDISEFLVGAVEQLNRLRETGATIDDFLNQLGLFGDTVSEETAAILRVMDKNTRSAKAVADYIAAHYDAVIALGSPKQANMFGDDTTPSRKEILDAAAQRSQREAGQQQGLFEKHAAREAGGQDQGQSAPAGSDAQGAAEEVAETPPAEEKPAKVSARGAKPKTEPATETKIEDFGEKIGGARKDVWAGFKSDLNAVSDDEIAAEPLSKVWPAPDYQKMIDEGTAAEVVATVRALRDEIPAKPRSSWKVKRWADQVKTLRGFANDIITGKHTLADMKRMAGGNLVLAPIFGRIDLYQAVGHDKSLQGVRLSHHHYTLYKGKENVRLWVVEQDSKATAFSNWPRELATGDTKEDAIAYFKAKYDALDLNKPASKQVTFEIYSKSGEKGYWIGKKIGRNPTLLEGPFATVKEARAYKDANTDKLIVKLEKVKEVPSERRDTNEPRVGVDMRNGQDVTPEMFGETFGFRGVEFGNWVENSKRQKDLNEAFDALMDMAAILNVPPKALSLNGELGLAFGARGTGGINPAKAHYEPGFVAINLTKKDGAGSLGHEWWHALDNYFSRLRGKKADMMTEALDVSLAARESDFIANTPVRKEMIVAFGNVVRAIKQTALKARSAKLDAKRSKEYWTTGPEMSARAFESYLISKLQDQNASNDYLANIVSEKTWKAAESLGFELEDSYPYPTAGEVPGIRAAFDKFFQTVETKEDEGRVAMYSVAPEAARQNRPIGQNDTAITAVLELASRHPEFFEYDTPRSKTVEGITAEIDPGYTVKEFGKELARQKGGDRAFEVSVPNSARAGLIVEKGDEVWIDVSKLIAGQDSGSRIYAIAAAYAHNNGKVLIGDPAGLSRKAFYRRTENMLSSALKYGTTKHLRPHVAQEIPGEYFKAEGYGDFGDKLRPLNWNEDDDVGNLKELVYTAYKSAIDNVPELKNVVFDPEQNRFTTLEGRPFSDDDFAKLVSKHSGQKGGTYSLGSRTAKRAAFYNTFLRGQSAEARKRILDQFGDFLSREQLIEGPLQRVMYSVQDGKPVAEFGPVHTEYKNDPKGAIERLIADQTGEAIIDVPGVGEISLVYGNGKMGLSHIAKRRGQEFVTERLPRLFESGAVYTKEDQPGRIFLGNDKKEATVRLDFNGQAKAWVVSAYEKYPDLAKAEQPQEARRSQTVEERTEKPLTVGGLKRAVTSGPIGQVIYSMLDAGVVVLHETSKSLPKELGRGVRGIQAVTAPDGKIHLVANALNASNARAVMLHEMFHRGGEGTIGSPRWSDLMGRMGSLYRQSEQSTGRAREFYDRARARVAAAKKQGAVSTRMEVEEFAAYAIEEYERAPDSLPAAIRKWVEDFIGMVKAFIYKTYGKQIGKLTPAQLAGFAKFALMDVAIARSEEIYGRKAPFANFSAREITKTPAFERWFAGSQVVDKDGLPLVVYHGTASDVAAFDPKKSGGKSKTGAPEGSFFFTDKPDVASSYTVSWQGDFSSKLHDGANVMPIYLSIKKPLKVNAKGESWREILYKGEWRDINEIAQIAKESGRYDGVIVSRVRDKGVGNVQSKTATTFIAFHSGQIKSVFNSGEFDPENPDIRYSVKPDDFDDLNDAQKSFLGKIGPEKPIKRLRDRVSQLTDNLALRMRQSGIDRYAALLRNDQELFGEDTLEGSIASSAWVLARMASSAGGAVTALLNAGRIYLDPKEKVIDIRDGSEGLAKTLTKLGSPAEIDRFMGWVAANRAKKLSSEGRENLFTPEEIEAGIQLSGGKLENGKSRSILYSKAWKEFQQHRDDVLGIAEAAGIITPEQRKTWSDEFYVPFYRVLDEENIGGPTSSGGLSRQQAVKKLKGGKQHLNDLLDNTLLNFHHLIQASLKNQAAVQAMKNAEKLGIAEKTSEAARDKKASTFVLEGGQKQFYNVNDQLTFKAVSAISYAGLNTPLMKAGRAFKRFFTNMTTITPQFVVANALRDSLQAMATSPTSSVPFKTAVKGALTWKDDHAKARMMASGGAFSFGHVYGQNADEIKASLTGQLRSAKVITDPKLIPSLLLAAWRKYHDVTNAAENMNRAGIWAETLDRKGKLKAAFEARDLMDFAAHGDAMAVRLMTDLVPFLNARLQGLDKLYRSGVKPGAKMLIGRGTKADKQAFARFATVVGALSIMSMLLFLNNYDDDEYRKLEDWQRDSYWVIRIGDEMFFIPKPFEVGSIATMAERTLEQFMDPTVGGEKFASRLGHMLTDTFAFNPIPQMVKPLYELGANQDTFTGRPIEDQGMQKLSPSLRTRPDTSRLADYASRGMEAVLDPMGGGDLAISPVQIDHLIKGYTGAAGAFAVGLADTLWRRASGEELPAKRWYEYQPIKRFYKNIADEDGYTRYGTDFYEALKKADRAYADYQHLMKYRQDERAGKLMDKEADTLAQRKWLDGVQRDLSKLNAEMKKVQMDKTISGDAKRLELDRLRSLRNLMTETVGKELEQERVRRVSKP